MLKHGEVNPLNVHGLRQLDWCPPHFACVEFDSHTSEKTISDWIYENLSGRFYIGRLDHTFPDPRIVVAFEDHSESSYFSLFIPQINQSDPLW